MGNTALVVGGLGVIGRRLIEHLETLPDWDIIALSRRLPDFPTRVRFIDVDLLDRAEAEMKLGGLRDITQVFYCAFQARPTWAEHNAPNLAMLRNSVAPVEAASPGLRHVHRGQQVVWQSSGAFQDARERIRPAAYAAELLLRPGDVAAPPATG